MATILGVMFFIGLLLILHKKKNNDKLDNENQTIDGEISKRKR